MDPTPDLRQHHEWLLALVELDGAARVVDLGCGSGHHLLALAARHADADARFVGLDFSAKALARAREACRADDRIAFCEVDLDAPLPIRDASVDVVFTNNLLECLTAPARLIEEIARILRDGGRVVAGHWDWESQSFRSTDPALGARVVHAYAWWQQSWMRNVDPGMGRRQESLFAACGAFDGAVATRALTNARYEPGWYGWARAQEVGSLVRRGSLASQDAEAFLADQRSLAERGEYGYSLTGYAYAGTRKQRASAG